MSLNVIGLVSGGKDSLYSLAHCIQNGHKVIALANLYPSATSVAGPPTSGVDGEGQDINSFMYQTVGHTIIPLYSDALGIPLFRQEIRGSAIQTGKYYDSTNIETLPDETEDLMKLLRKVLSHHPDANAVSSGAILSTYQRTRVESVALRLGLTPLSYLWQYPALPPPIGREDSLTGLLDDMQKVGCDARIIKIASGGIKESLLWSNVSQSTTKSRLVTGMAPFFEDQEFWLRGAVLGEGGEYETLSSNGPPSLWKKRIDVKEAGSFVGEGGTSYVKFSGAKLCDRDEQAIEEHDLPIPTMLDQQFVSILEDKELKSFETMTYTNSDRLDISRIQTLQLLPFSVARTSSHLTINNITSFNIPSPVQSTEPASQLEAIVTQLPSIISHVSLDLTTASIVSSTLLLRCMSNFANVNPIYSRLWPTGRPNPPARVTVAIPLPPDVHVAISVVLSLEPTDLRQGLHVQSRSYWAPANIGPYSQAIHTPLNSDRDNRPGNIHDARRPEAIHVAGQIPLVPADMEMLQAPFSEQAVLALQHLWRIGQDRNVDTWTWGVAYLEGNKADTLERVIASMKIWQAAHEKPTHRGKQRNLDEDGDGCGSDTEAESTVDVWDLQHNRSRGFGFGSYNSAAAMTVGQHLHILPNNTIFEAGSVENSPFIPPLVVAEVTSLPRDAPVEWWSMGLSGLAQAPRSTRYQAAIPTTQNFAIGNQSWGGVAGITLKFHHSLDSEDAHHGLDFCSESRPGNQWSRITFATILLNMDNANEMKHIPKTPSELLELLQSKQPDVLDGLFSDNVATHEVVHATLFFNLSSVSSSISSTELMKLPLFQSATVLPCYRVWACSDWDRRTGTELGRKSLSKITETAAALLVRIDSKFV